MVLSLKWEEPTLAYISKEGEFPTALYRLDKSIETLILFQIAAHNIKTILLQIVNHQK